MKWYETKAHDFSKHTTPITFSALPQKKMKESSSCFSTPSRLFDKDRKKQNSMRSPMPLVTNVLVFEM